ncbi:MAG: electron transfer flavoprotein subunit beta/FixA family protein [Desulfurococcaceae archaeon]
MAVLVKPTPDITKVRFDVERGTVDRSGAELEINPFDLYAVEAAVKLKETFGATITAISMAPMQGEKALRDAIARGVDRAVLLTDKKFAGADTLSTSYTLASAIRKLGGADLILCGEKSVDGDTAHIGPEVAEHLGIPHASFVTHIQEVTGESIVVESDYGSAYYSLELKLPAVLAVSRPLLFKGKLIEPRIPKLSDVLKARRAKIDLWDANTLGDVADPTRFGLSGSPTRVIKAFYALEKTRTPAIIKGEEAVLALLKILLEKGVIA